MSTCQLWRTFTTLGDLHVYHQSREFITKDFLFFLRIIYLFYCLLNRPEVLINLYFLSLLVSLTPLFPEPLYVTLRCVYLNMYTSLSFYVISP